MGEPNDGAVGDNRPQHVQVAEHLIKDGLSYGHVIPHDDLRGRFGLQSIAEIEMGTALQFKHDALVYLSLGEGLREYFLSEHQLYLDNVRGQGYRVVPPAEQASLTERKLSDDLAKAFAKARMRIDNIRLSELTAAERREALDKSARMSDLRGMVKSKRRGWG